VTKRMRRLMGMLTGGSDREGGGGGGGVKKIRGFKTKI